MFATYAEFEVPNVREFVDLNGDFSWSGLEVNVKDTPWDTFKANENLHRLVQSPTACYVDFSEYEGKTVFYRNQQDCIIWSIDPNTGKVYSNAREDPIPDDVEEFWLRQHIESILWFKNAMNVKFENEPEYFSKYEEFYSEK